MQVKNETFEIEFTYSQVSKYISLLENSIHESIERNGEWANYQDDMDLIRDLSEVIGNPDRYDHFVKRMKKLLNDKNKIS